MDIPPEALSALSDFGALGGLLAIGVWFGKRFLALHDQLLMRLDRVIEEAALSRAAMDAARRAFEPKDGR